jgi:hypothetical protein
MNPEASQGFRASGADHAVAHEAVKRIRRFAETIRPSRCCDVEKVVPLGQT